MSKTKPLQHLTSRYQEEIKYYSQISDDLHNKIDESKTSTKRNYYAKKLAKNNKKLMKSLLKLNEASQLLKSDDKD